LFEKSKRKIAGDLTHWAKTGETHAIGVGAFMLAFDYAAWARRFVGIVTLSVAVGAFGSPARSATAAEIKKLIEDLSAALPQADGQLDAVWGDQAEKLRAQLSKLKTTDDINSAVTRAGELEALLKGKAVTSSSNARLLDSMDKLNTAAAAIEANDPVTAFNKQLTRLRDLATMQGFPSSHPDVQKALSGLHEIATKIETPDPAGAFRWHANTLLAVTPTAAPGLTQADATDTTTKLIDTLGKVEIAYPAHGVVQRANRATQAIKDQIPNAASAVATDGNVRTALQALRDEATRALGLVQSRIHIIAATYGASGSRRCNATAAMLQACERRPNCALPTPATNLCGYDPAASADTASKAAYVDYQCVIGGEDTWAPLDISDGIQAPGIRVRHASLRTAAQSLVCTQPAP
jgi:hypothetical protein